MELEYWDENGISVCQFFANSCSVAYAFLIAYHKHLSISCCKRKQDNYVVSIIEIHKNRRYWSENRDEN